MQSFRLPLLSNMLQMKANDKRLMRQINMIVKKYNMPIFSSLQYDMTPCQCVYVVKSIQIDPISQAKKMTKMEEYVQILKPWSPGSCSIIILHLPRQDHHPQEQDGLNDGPCERGLPTGANVVLGQPSQSFNGDTTILLARDIVVTVAVDISAAVELDGGFDECGDPQDEEDEGAEQDTARDQHSLRGEDEDDGEEEDGEAASDNGKGEDPEKRVSLGLGARMRPRGRLAAIPGNSDSKLILHRDEPSIDSQNRGGAGKHNKDPQIQLHLGPSVFPPGYNHFGGHGDGLNRSRGEMRRIWVWSLRASGREAAAGVRGNRRPLNDQM